MGKKLEKLNPQASARQEKLLLGVVKPPPGHVFYSRDLAAGEPTVISHYSKDKNYFDATLGYIGKAPEYHGDILKIDDLYLTGAALSPMYKKMMRELFNSKFGTSTFSEKWLEKDEKGKDIGKEFIISQIKAPRKLSKIFVLGLGYGMQPKKMVKQAYDSGFNVTVEQAREFHRAYWQWAAGVKRFGDQMAAKFEREGYLVNQFGFRLVPDKKFKALNYMIQSSVSGLMNILIPQILEECPHEKFVGIVHDELLSYGNQALIEESRLGTIRAQERLNKTLNWSVPMRVGFVYSDNLHGAK